MILANDFQKIKKHISLSACQEICEIMLPMLKKHGITVFNYYRMYFDGGMIRLSTERIWTEHFFKKNYANQLTIPESYLAKSLNYYIWLAEDCSEILLDAAINFNIANGISIAEKQEDSIEFFCFGSTRDNYQIINNFYINNLDLLLNYSRYFKEKAKHWLKLAEEKRIILSSVKHSTKENNLILQKNYQNNLTERQTDCAFLLIKGMKYKEIARKLKLSPRTVETHLNHLKTKLNCSNKTQLIVKLSDMMK